MYVVAVDGPAGSGKSSVAREVASRLGFGYLDTGAGYRALTLFAISNPEFSIEKLLAGFSYETSLDPSNQWQRVAGEDVTERIREPEVAHRVSEFARMPAVRDYQREDARQRIASCSLPGILVEGRDITTVVAPEAQLRVLLTASELVRLQRRGLQGGEVAENILKRDQSDSQVVDFMEPANGVVLLDTTDLGFTESVEALIDLIERHRKW
jgi:CMP/dCMP kinase